MPVEIAVDDILSKFKDIKPLDKGGQKIVFTTVHPSFGLCVLKIGAYGTKQTLDRITREVSILRTINSEYFPRQYAFEIIDSQRYYILEEFLEGEPLNKRFADFTSEREIAVLGVHLTLGLQQLWKQNIVHRDVKPKNIIITKNGPRIIDLGIARLLDATSLTNTLAPFGPCTPDYASPEQLENRKNEIKPRCDQFNLGIIAGQLLLSGAHPFAPEVVGSGESIPHNILADNWAREFTSVAATPPMFAMIQKLLGHEPFQRYRKSDDLLADMKALAKE